MIRPRRHGKGGREGVEGWVMIEAWRNAARAGTGSTGGEGRRLQPSPAPRRAGGPSRPTSAQAPQPRRPRAVPDEGGRVPGHGGQPGPRVIPLTREDECGARDVRVVPLNHSGE